MNSRVWKGRLNKLRATSSPNANSFPAVPTGARIRSATAEAISRSTSGGHGHVRLERPRRGFDAVLLAPCTGIALTPPGLAVGRFDLERDRREGRAVQVPFRPVLARGLLLPHRA